MSKIQKITISNFKALKGSKSLDLKGCSAIITGGNRKGKTSLLKGIIERIRFIRPDVIVNEGEEAGKGELVLVTIYLFNPVILVNVKFCNSFGLFR